MANEEKELHKFVYNPKYREKVIARVHKENEYSANGRPLVTVEKSTQYAKQVHLTKKLNTVGSPF